MTKSQIVTEFVNPYDGFEIGEMVEVVGLPDKCVAIATQPASGRVPFTVCKFWFRVLCAEESLSPVCGSDDSERGSVHTKDCIERSLS